MSQLATQTASPDGPPADIKSLRNDICGPEYQFTQIQSSGVSPRIKNLGDYVLTVEAGISRALKVAAARRFLSNPSIRDIKEQHALIFKDIHPWAGNFRRPNQFVRFGSGEIAGGLPDRVKPELSILFKQTKFILNQHVLTQGMDIAPAVAIAFFHVRFTRIHPFVDGNGRVSRTLMSGQIIEAYNREFVIPPRDIYKTALHRADNGDLGGLVQIVCPGIKSLEVESPFHICPLGKVDLAGMRNLKDEYQTTMRKMVSLGPATIE